MGKQNKELIEAIEKLHNCKASYLDGVFVIEKFRNKTVWQGIVHIFRLIDHPQSEKCYVWYSNNPKTRKQKFYAVLHLPPIDSPEKAVRASIVYDHKVGIKKEK
jgi:hypothetical protein